VGLPFFSPKTAIGLPAVISSKVAEADPAAPDDSNPTAWSRTVSANGTDHIRLKPEAIEDIWAVCEYSLNLA